MVWNYCECILCGVVVSSRIFPDAAAKKHNKPAAPGSWLAGNTEVPRLTRILGLQKKPHYAKFALVGL